MDEEKENDGAVEEENSETAESPEEEAEMTEKDEVKKEDVTGEPAADEDGLREYRETIEHYRSEGWDTGILERALMSGDGENISRIFEEFPKSIERLKSLKKKVEELRHFFPPNTPYKGATYEEILERLNNPEAIPWIELEVENREKKIEEAKEALEKALERWSAYDTSYLQREFGSVPEIYSAIREFESGIEMLDRLRDEIAYLSNSGMLTEEDRKKLRDMLMNPAAAGELEKILNSIYSRARKKGKEELLEQIREWEEQGIDVSPIREIEGEDIATLRKEVERFGHQVRRLKELRKRLNAIDPSVKEEAEPLKEMLTSVKNIREIESRLNSLEQDVWRRKEQLMKRARELKRKGVDIGDFELRAMTSTVAEMEERLKKMEKEVRSEGGTEKSAGELPDISPLKKEPVSRVGELIQRRERILQQIEEWRKQGYDVSGLEAVKDQDINTLEEIFRQFSEGVEKIEEIRRGIEEFSGELREEAERIIGEINNPLNYFEAERKFLYLQEKADYMRRMSELSGVLKRARSTLDEVRSLEFEPEMVPAAPFYEEDELAEYRKRLKEWRNTGYNTARLELALRTRVPELVKRMFASFERDVERLKEIEKSLDRLDTTGFRKREKQIREKLQDPEEVITTLKHFIELEMDIRRRMKMDV